jgi:hypothetical protein
MTSINIPILSNSDILVSKGEKIKAGHTLARTKGEGSPDISISNLLKVDPGKIKSVLVKKDGSKVRKGEVFARKGGVLSTTQIKSPASGRLELVKDRVGYVRVVTSGSAEIASPVDGVVEDISENGVVVGSKLDVLVGNFGEGNARGELFEVEGKKIFDIDKSVAGKIVFGEGLEAAGVAKISVLGGVGAIVDKKLRRSNLAYVILEDPGVLREYVGRKVEIVNSGGHYLIVT